MVSDLRRPRVQHARNTRCWKTRANSLRRAALVCNAARTRTPPRRRGTPRRAARSEWPMCAADAAEAALPARCERALAMRYRVFLGGRSLRVSTRAAALFPGMRVLSIYWMPRVSVGAGEPHVRMGRASMRVVAGACVCSGAYKTALLHCPLHLHVCLCCGCGVSRMSDVARRRAPVPVCASLLPSLLPGWPSVIGPREARPSQARVARTLYGCRRVGWAHGTRRRRRGDGQP